MKPHAKLLTHISLILIVFVAYFASPFNSAYAINKDCAKEDNPEECDCSEGNTDIEECLYIDHKKAWYKIDIRRTVNNALVSAALYPATAASGRSVGQMQACANKEAVDNGLENEETGEILVPAPTLEQDPNCDGMTLDTLSETAGATTTGGSLMGVALQAEHYAAPDSMPINLAYFLKHTARKVPILNQTAYAAADPTYSSIYLEYIIDVWEVARNISYGLLALVMLVVGFMVMTRKQINPQASVTVQNALPRIIIAIILITFSYPIGALAYTLILPLVQGVVGIFTEVLAESSGYNPSAPMLILTLVMGAIFMGGSGIGIFSVLVAIVVLIVLLFALVTFFMRLISVHFKILILIVVAPLMFAWSAIPGNEHLITDWFKRLAAYVLAVPAMMFMMSFAIYIGLRAVTLSPSGLEYIPAILLYLSSPLFMLYLLLASTRIPNMVEAAIRGDDTKKKKK